MNNPAAIDRQEALALTAQPATKKKRFMDSFVPKTPKSAGWALALTLLFGPFGALYIGWKYAAAMVGSYVALFIGFYVLVDLYVNNVTVTTTEELNAATTTLESVQGVFSLAWFVLAGFFIAFAHVLAQRSQGKD